MKINGKTPTEQAEKMIGEFKAILIHIDSDISQEIILTQAAKELAIKSISFMEKTELNKLYWELTEQKINEI
jgi:hypothetical protein